MSLTREEALDSIIGADPVQDFPVMASNDVKILIHKIFDDHEAQLKAKDEGIKRLNNLYADTIKDLGDALMEIDRLEADSCSNRIANTVEEYISRIPSRGELEIRFKSDYPYGFKMKEMPKHIRERTEHGENYANALIKMMIERMIDRTKEINKARSIVAMLFWNYKHNLFAFDVEATVIVESKRIFEKAYKMLKMV